MNKTLLLFSISFLSVYFFNSQAQTYNTFFADQICNSVKDVDIELQKIKLAELVQSKATKIYAEHPTRVRQYQAELKKEYPTKSEEEITLLFGIRVSFQAMESCPKFQKIAQKAFTPDPKKYSKSMISVSEQLCSLLSRTKATDYDQLEKIVDDEMYDLVIKNKDLIEKEYDNVYIPTYNEDLIPILMKNCSQYFMLMMKEQLE